MRATTRSGFDSFALAAKPAKEFGEIKYLRLEDAAAQTFIYLRNPAPRGATIVSATLRLHARGHSTGARTLTARRISESWRAGRLSWERRPAVTETAATAAVGALADGDAIDFDVTEHVQAFAYGASHFGWRVVTDATTAHRVYGLDAGQLRPQLIVEWSDAPGVPTDLSPSGGVVSVAKPVVSFSYHDDDQDSLAAVQVQIDPAADAVAPDFDSGEVAVTVSELDLATTAFPGLALGATTQMRARVKDAGGRWSQWSDWASFSRVAKSTLTITNPAAAPNDFVTEPTPPILWTFTGVQTAYRVRIFKHWTEIYDSGKVPGSATSLTLPAKSEGRRVLRDDNDYAVEVRVWDDQDRIHTRGDSVFVAAVRAFTVDDSDTVAPPVITSVAQDGLSPAVLLGFTRATAPDSFNILRDGQVIDTDVDPADLFAGGTSYSYRDATASPDSAHTYAVRAVVNGVQSQKATSAAVTIEPVGMWLMSVDAEVMLLDPELEIRLVDQVNTYAPLGSRSFVRIVAGTGLFEGRGSGNLVATAGVDVSTALEALEAMQAAAHVPVRLVVRTFSRDVLLGDLTPVPSQTSGRGARGRVEQVSFNLWSA